MDLFSDITIMGPDRVIENDFNAGISVAQDIDATTDTRLKYKSLGEQWIEIPREERIKKILFLISSVSAGLYYVFILFLLLSS